jgi:hypothetical protein
MSKQIVPQHLLSQWRRTWAVNPAFTESIEQYIANRAAAWALEQAASLCDENGRSDGHTCAKEIRALIGGQENGA